MIARLAGLAALSLLLRGCAATPGPADGASRFEVFVLGRAQDGGLPHVGCDRETCCAEARRSGRVETPACLGIHDRETGALALIEATPAVERQLGLLHELAASRPRVPPQVISDYNLIPEQRHGLPSPIPWLRPILPDTPHATP